MRSARIIQLRLPLCPLTEVNRPLLLQCGNSSLPTRDVLPATCRQRSAGLSFRRSGEVVNVSVLRQEEVQKSNFFILTSLVDA